MFLTIHGPMGALIGAWTGEPVSAFLLGVVSHAVLDAIPHGDERLFRGLERHACIRAVFRTSVIDAAVLAGVLLVMLRPDRAWPSMAVMAGIAGGVLPDVASGLALFFPSVPALHGYHKIHTYIHDGIIRYDPSLLAGFAIQALMLAITLATFSRLGLG